MQVRTLLTLVVIICLMSCASMDLRLDKLPGPAYGEYKPRVQCDKIEVYQNEKPSRPYIVIAKYIVQEEPTVLTSHSSSEMVVYAGKRACEDGADAIIIENFDVVNVPGGYARQTPKVTIVGIRYRN